MADLQLIVGLGNPGLEYAETRHNAGFRYLGAVCRLYGVTLKSESRFKGHVGRCQINGREVLLLAPMTFMNASGEAVAALARFYKIEPEAILVAHDELDLPLGVVRLKQGGGTGGHNGLASMQQLLGSQAFLRVRLGIGRPPPGRDVVGYVLGRSAAGEIQELDQAIDRALAQLPDMIAGNWQMVMGRLHTESS